MSGHWNDFNDAQSNINLIPKGTLAKVRLTIRPGGFDDPAQAGPAAMPSAAARALSISMPNSRCSKGLMPSARSGR